MKGFQTQSNSKLEKAYIVLTIIQISIKMVKREEISTRMKGYCEEGKLGALEALYMWSRGIDTQTIASVLNNKYDSTEGFSTMKSDLNELEIQNRSSYTELTNESIDMVIGDVFRKLQQVLLDKVTENLATISSIHKGLLLTMIRSSLFEKERIRLDELKIAYHAIFGETMRDFELVDALLYLEKVGVFYCERPRSGSQIETIIIPNYIYAVRPQIEGKLPSVHIAEGEGES